MMLALDTNAAYGDFTLQAKGDFDLDGVTALFGASGSGKTSLLNTIAGFNRANGRIICGSEVWEERKQFVPAWKRSVGTVFQDSQLFSHLSVEQNLKFGLSRAGRVRLGMDEVLAATGAGPLLDRSTPNLSGGETRRVAIARTLLAQPSLLLLDEPLVGLDDPSRIGLLRLIRSLPQRFAVPVIYVSHRVDEIAAIADNVIVMDGGKITASGETVSILGSLGSGDSEQAGKSSLLLAHMTGYDSQYCLASARIGDETVSVICQQNPVEGSLVRLRIRASDVALARERVIGTSVRNQLPVQIAGIAEFSPGICEVQLTVGDQVFSARVTNKAIADLQLQVGDTVVALIKAVTFDEGLSTLGFEQPAAHRSGA